MNTHSHIGSRAGRISAAAAGLGVAALVVAPGAMADGTYKDVAPKPHTQVLGVKHAAPPAKAVTPVTQAASPASLAVTGVEVGAAGLVGLALVAGGAVLVRSGRRGTVTA